MDTRGTSHCWLILINNHLIFWSRSRTLLVYHEIQTLLELGVRALNVSVHSSCAGRLRNIRKWLDRLIDQGEAFGYQVEPTKSIIIVSPDLVQQANDIFGDLNIQVATSARFLGGCIGEPDGVRSFVKERVETWVSSVNCLAAATRKYPQSAYCALNRSLSCEWSYLQRVVQGLEEEFAPLRDVILEQFAPAILGREVLPRGHKLLTLPVKYGGLALADPVHTAPQAYQNSRNATDILRNSIQSGNPVNVNDHSAHCRRITSQISRERDVISAEISQSILSDLPQLEERTLSRIVRGNASGWLTVLPLKREGYDLSSTEFRDQLAIRYRRQPLALPAQCDGCGKPFSLQHGLDCPKGGLIKRGHNDLRDSDAKLADMAFGGVVVEPIMVPEGDRTGQPALRADWLARGV